jgi:hypothetical protein
MKSKKSSPTKKDKTWQQRVEKQAEVEKLKLDHPEGKERFERAVKQAKKLSTKNS